MNEWEKLVKYLSIILAVIFVTMMAMSALGAENYSLHLISLKTGWTSFLWDCLWSGLIAGTFFILGGFYYKFVMGEH